MSSSTKDTTSATAESQGSDTNTQAPSTVAPVAPEGETRKLTERNHSPKLTRGRGNKRDFLTSAETNAKGPESESSPAPPAAKKPTAADRPEFEEKEAEKEAKTRVIDIDQKHADDPQYAPKIAPQLYTFLRHLERMLLPGTNEALKPAKEYKNLTELRMSYINAMFQLNNRCEERHEPPIPSDTLHLAIYYIDRFLERYDGEKDISLGNITTTALFLASKYEDVEPIYLNTLFKQNHFGKATGEDATLQLEVLFEQVLHILQAPTTTAFAHRFLQAVDLELNMAAVHTARYFCALGVAHFPLTGQYYSKIAAAAVFIAFNKYRAECCSPPGASEAALAAQVDFPASLAEHSHYTASDIAPIVRELMKAAKDVETLFCTNYNSRTRASFKDKLPTEIYRHYKKAGVHATCVIPDFEHFFSTVAAEEAASSSEKEEDSTAYQDSETAEQENPESSHDEST